MKEILVYADWSGLPEIMKIGKLRSDVVRGQEIFSFEYDKSWINSGFAQELDPDLKLLSGRQYIRDNKPNFGLFMDSSPDRWGRMLMDRKEALIAYQGRRKPIKLTESDYLLEVSDASRMGALRFKLDEEG
ncbi:MAG: HipA N-terminal domain-containing protein, partial [Candidatus Marinimicrobia bacterium]|nr:HipA N-terminal domain-containing protein [Candidatus Neomarinimicrobiota bacterium]